MTVASNGCGCAARIGIRRSGMDKEKKAITVRSVASADCAAGKGSTQPRQDRRNQQRNPGPDPWPRPLAQTWHVNMR